jgi:putative ABC transport system permease protein
VDGGSEDTDSLDHLDSKRRFAQASTVFFHYDLFDEGRSFGKGTVGWIEARVDNPANSAAIANKIDVLFANSPNETKTQPANDFAMTFVKQIGDIGFVLRAILGAVFFTLLFLTGNTMMQSVRERIPELAVLKTLGFTDGKVLGLVIGESLMLCVFAAIIGLALSYAALPVIGKALQGVQLDPVALIPGLGAAVLLALIVGLPPAWRAMRLSIVDALSGMH